MMAGVVLRPVDGGQDIELPLGKTTVGRGPFFGVSSVHEVCVYLKLSRSEVRYAVTVYLSCDENIPQVHDFDPAKTNTALCWLCLS